MTDRKDFFELMKLPECAELIFKPLPPAAQRLQAVLDEADSLKRKDDIERLLGERLAGQVRAEQEELQLSIERAEFDRIERKETARLSARAKWEASQQTAQAMPAPERPRVLLDLKGKLREHSRSLRDRRDAIETARLAKLAELEAERDFHEIEATRKQAAPAQTAATPAPVGTGGASDFMNWTLIKPQRFPGYSKPLYDLLKAAHTAGQPCPKARDVLDKWKENPPPDVATVTDNGLKYYGANGNTKPADLEAIRKAIDRMIR